MKILTKVLILALIMLGIATHCHATHNRAGEIVYEHIAGYRYKIIVYTYCYTQTEADRDELEVDCGDGTEKLLVKRTSKTTLDDIGSKNYSFLCKNIYVGEHTYSGPGTYVLYMEDPNRNEGVDNIPNSVNTVFAIKTTLMINVAAGDNSSPILLNAPMDKAALHRTFVHNPGAYDPDGDSLSYRIARCLQQDAQEIVGYTLPPVTDSIYVNPITGDFVWEKPAQKGTYNVAMWIEEWRNGIKIGQVLRDIQVEVIDADNHTPVIDKTGNHCVVADSLLKFKVTASDPDFQNVQLSASGGPFAVKESPAEFRVSRQWVKNPVGNFSWQTRQSHVRNQPYDMLVKATDDDPVVPLTGYSSINIRVIAPAPHITSIESTNSSAHLEWDNGGNTKAVGFRIYRKDRPDDYEPGVCETGMPSSSGYVLVDEVRDLDKLSYVDDDHGIGLPTGFRYCYRITAIFADGAESLPSDPSCTTLARGFIMFTKASVAKTDEADGVIDLEWSEPEELDSALIPPPYYYLLFPARGIKDGLWEKAEELEGLHNTKKTDKGFDSKNMGSMYKVTFANLDEANNNFNDVGASAYASSVFIKLECGDRRITITHDADVPWKNDTFVIYRKDPGSATFDSVGVSTSGKYTDYNLENDKEYGYKMKTIGYYSAPGLPTHIENWSQEAYGTPIDTIAPCIRLTVHSDCENGYNHLMWQPDSICGLGIAKYMIYYSSTLDGQLSKIEEAEPTATYYDHYPTMGLAGCYYVTARDSAGNEGVADTRICVDNCEDYRLPNVFTPNGDGINDIFHPYPYQFVERVDMTITNRWGKVVFETSDPDLNWDGKDQKSGNQLPDGVYFYRCTVYEHRLTGLEEREIEGYITIFTKPSKNQ
ncbi:MAG: gliding motility-associated C-terminal domain-containing protein [Bacteroidales bacterium]|nr:gliding motility-associated C-terminal domain-containing protein [Bacteroidales bacterium]